MKEGQASIGGRKAKLGGGGRKGELGGGSKGEKDEGRLS